MNTNKATEIFNAIQTHLKNPKAKVSVGTVYRVTMFKAKHAEMFRLAKDGSLQHAQGRGWVTIASPTIGALVSIQML